MNSEQLQSMGKISATLSASSGIAPYIEWFNNIMLSIDGFVGIYYDTMFITFTLLSGWFSAYCFFRIYKMKKKRYAEKTEKHNIEMEIMRDTGKLID